MPEPAFRSAIRTLKAGLRRALTASLNQRPATLVVAVSGGPDSLSLLHALQSLGPGLSLNLHAAHLDHGLRGAEGADDRRFVAETCEAWGIPATTAFLSVPDYLRSHSEVTSVEAAARAVRYRFLHQVAAAAGADAVVTGHTRDDQAETLLLHLVRGAGLSGLQGMAADSLLQTDVGSLRVLRPLLDVSRAATHRYCAAAGLQPRTDETNASLSYTRNRLRHTAMPALRALNPRLEDALSQLATQAQQEQAYWDAEVARVLPTLSTPFPGGVMLQRAGLRGLPSALQRRILRAATSAIAPGLEVSFDHTSALESLVRGPSGKRLILPEGPLHAVTTYQHLVLTSAQLDLGPAPPPLAVGGAGKQRWGHWFVGGGHTAPQAPDFWAVAVPASSPVILRTRHPGDRFGRSKLQDALVNAHCPELLRDHLPVLSDANGLVLWVPGLGRPNAKGLPTHAGTWLRLRPASAVLASVLRLWEGRSYNDEVP